VTGGGGVLGGAISAGLAAQGAVLCLVGRNQEKLKLVQKRIEQDGWDAFCYQGDVMDRDTMNTLSRMVQDDHGRIDVLINCAGGNIPGATIMPDQMLADIDSEALQSVLNLNILGTVLPSIEVSKVMIKQKKGSIINISSMAAALPLTRVLGYSAAKAAVDNFTKWMAVEMATKHSEEIRVNAIAPGFFIAEQNRMLLLEDDGSFTKRGKTIISQTPMKRFGEPEELIGVAHWLSSDASRFVTGAIIPVDGGFSAFSGV
jgi:NAD(P)-dependent dehydrogenase (short-subunit alcohol dehydrogenase family)